RCDHLGAPPPARSPAGFGARIAHYHWAILLARRFSTFPLLRPQRGAELRLIAFVTALEPVSGILTHLGEPAAPPRIAPARGPPARDDLLEPLPDWAALAPPAPEFELDQRIAW
ncbi:MAG: IS91 family transposase, partial [Chromatiaceae bacterium]